jgi:CBS domain containing-hemolysin-like protein
MHGLALLQFVAVAMLILANAFFVAAEFALVSVRETRVEQMMTAKVPGSRAVFRLQQNMDEVLPAVQLGVTLCSLALGWIGEPLVAALFMGWMDALGLNLAHALIYAHVIAAALAIAFITYMDVLAGELVPKSLALRRADALAVAVAPPMLIFMAITRPAVRVLRLSAAAVLRGFDVPMSERANVHSPEELKLIATSARRMGLLPPLQETLVHRALELDDVTVREIMTPRQKIFSLPSNMPIEQASAHVIEQMHSRVPVYDESRGPEHIVGIVYSKDLARLMYFRPATSHSIQIANDSHTTVASCVEKMKGESPDREMERERRSRVPVPFYELKLSQVMHHVLVVPETKPVLDLIRDFQQQRRQMAIVVDEFGSTAGLVTAEDAVEQLTGEWEDEFDDPARPIITLASGALLMDGNVNLRDLETQMQWDLPRDGGVETLAGFMLMRLGHIPVSGEVVEYEKRRLTVVEMDGRRIGKVRVEAIEEDSTTEEESEIER